MAEHEDTYDLFQRGREHMRRGDNAQATVSLEKAKRREPDKASIREALGVAYLRMHRYHEAAAEFEHILAAAPANDYAHYCLGRCLDRLGEPPHRTRPLQDGALAAPERYLLPGSGRRPPWTESPGAAARRHSPPVTVQPDRHRPVVYERDVHVGAEAAGRDRDAQRTQLGRERVDEPLARPRAARRR